MNTLAVLTPLLLLLAGLGITVWIDPYIGMARRRVMLLIVVLCLSLIPIGSVLPVILIQGKRRCRVT